MKPAGGTLTYSWSAAGITFSNPAISQPTALFPAGSATATVAVAHPGGASAGDTVQITVVDTTPPVLTVPPDITISTCIAPNVGTASATDAYGGTVTITNNKPATFPLGTTVVTYWAVDAFGNPTSRTQRVTAVLGDSTSCCPPGTNSDCILGLGAQDTINGLGGNDYISGGEGDDVIDGGSGNDQVFGGNGQDTLRGCISESNGLFLVIGFSTEGARTHEKLAGTDGALSVVEEATHEHRSACRSKRDVRRRMVRQPASFSFADDYDPP